ncbi:MAG: histidine kinase [Bacteroidetes bacterium]|nr:histidine kinase [Bacteroidota bacterium]
MSNNKQIERVQMMIYILIWAILIVFPVLTSGRSGNIRWNQVFGEWIRLVPFIFIFLLHHYLLLPQLIKGERRSLYLAGTLILIVIVSVLSPNLRFVNDWISPDKLSPLNPAGPVDDPFGGPAQRPPMDNMQHPPRQNPRQADPQNTGLLPPLVYYNFVVSILLVGFDAAIVIFSHWFRQEQRSKEIEKNHLQTELAFLRNQVSPHFFLNTLNNIHALIDEDQAKAQDAVIRLSKLMRYLLYETHDGKVQLTKETEFLLSYFDLMRIRYDDQVRIDVNLPDDIPNVLVPPLLHITFIENAFKHGVSYQSESFVEFNMQIVDESIEYRIRNSKPDKNDSRLPTSACPDAIGDSPTPGIGLENIRRQLDVLFGSSYNLSIREENNSYFVFLKTPLNDD